MVMSNPPHPGRSIRENCLDPLGLNVTEAAKVLGVARHTLSRVLNGHAAISPEMAIRLEKAGWSNAEFWLRRQTTWDLVQARKKEDRIVVLQRRAIPAGGVAREHQALEGESRDVVVLLEQLCSTSASCMTSGGIVPTRGCWRGSHPGRVPFLRECDGLRFGGCGECRSNQQRFLLPEHGRYIAENISIWAISRTNCQPRRDAVATTNWITSVVH